MSILVRFIKQTYRMVPYKFSIHDMDYNERFTRSESGTKTFQKKPQINQNVQKRTVTAAISPNPYSTIRTFLKVFIQKILLKP